MAVDLQLVALQQVVDPHRFEKGVATYTSPYLGVCGTMTQPATSCDLYAMVSQRFELE